MYRKLGITTSARACDTCYSAVYCLPDSAFHAASLCSSCDVEIHQRMDDDVAEAASWLVLNPEKSEECLEFAEDCNSCGETENLFCGVPRKSYELESVVSVQNEIQQQQVQRFQLDLEFHSSKPAYGSLTQTVSISPTAVNIAPESTISEVSISHSNPAIGTASELSSGPPILMPSYLTYREERVLRYREKKKTRKFEKKVRYASRKAYAEVRPRIKGRFAKRNNVEAEMDQMFSSTLITEADY